MAKPQTVGETVAQRIREYRTLKKWSVRKLADECAALGVTTLTQASITHIERGISASDEKRGSRGVTVDELMTLAYVLDVRPGDLLTPDEVPVEIVPGVVAHPFVARTWIEGSDFTEPSIWGAPINAGSSGMSLQHWTYWNFDHVYRMLIQGRETLEEDRKHGAPSGATEGIYAGRLLQLAMIYEVSERSNISLPPIPQWIHDDLRSAERAGELHEPEFISDPRKRMTKTGRPVKLPGRIDVIPAEEKT
jgi:transcriptional regulator with XRE-family HTH domain